MSSALGAPIRWIEGFAIRDAVTTRTLLVLYLIVVVGLSLYGLGFFLWNRVYLIGSDTFYYLAIADTLLKSGSFIDEIVNPAQPLKTPQNGVVLFHVIFSSLGLGAEGRLVAIVVLNYALHVSAIYPLYKIARRLGVEGTVPIAALLAVHLGAFQVYRMQLLPMNDGAFNALSIWLTYLILIGLQDYRTWAKLRETGNTVNWRLVLISLVGLSAVLVHYRFHVVLILGAAMLAAMAVAQYRHVLWAAVLLIVAFVSLAVPYSFVDTRGIEGQTDRVLTGILSRAPSGLFDLVTVDVPNLFFAPVSERASLIYFPFALALALALLYGVRRREPGVLFIALSCSAAFAFLAVLPFGGHRLLMYILPLMFLLILLPVRFRPIAYMFVGLILASSLVTFATGFDRVPASKFFLYLYEHRVSLPADDPLLVSQRSRHPYFFLSSRTYRGELTWDLIRSHGDMFVLGDGEYVSERLEEIEDIAKAADVTFKRRTLTPGYEDEEGHTLLQLYDFGRRKG